jgi:acyl-coenzyme A thioesterase PaaI-like protein
VNALAVPEEEPDPAIQAARNRAGQAVRNFGHALVGHHASAELLDSLAVTLDDLAGVLAAGEPRSRPMWTFDTWHPAPADGEAFSTFEDRPVSGTSSPLGCDLRSRRDGDEAVTTFTLRAAHEGAPGRSHGGIVSAIFDDVMGFVIQLVGEPAFTGELRVRYEHGVPLYRPLQMRARLSSRQGRKLHITADLWDGEVRLASASSTFIVVNSETLESPD